MPPSVTPSFWKETGRVSMPAAKAVECSRATPIAERVDSLIEGLLAFIASFMRYEEEFRSIGAPAPARFLAFTVYFLLF
ncbi:hypothetical protein [Rhizobium leguminosarum]|uniref:hypothetical protein n=1 Tax=Rhizobium leguminosarum TaxID=384 RepID=UPI0021BC0486|nr:hypothetical protein [Rhizobium leguminosarum]